MTGGGQPIISAQDRMDINPYVLRAKATYAEDASKPKRKSHENGEVKLLYKKFLRSPTATRLTRLHTHYQAHPKYQ